MPLGALIGGAVALVAVVALVVVLVVVRSSSTSVASPTPAGPPASPAAAEPSSVATTPTTAVSSDPETQLQSTADADAGQVEGLVGSWVPQLSAKRNGLVADGTTYDAASILANHQSLVGRYPEAKLLRSGDYSTYASGGFWVTVLAQPFPTAAGANAWCDAQGIAPTECYAKLISHTASAAGSTKLRPGS